MSLSVSYPLNIKYQGFDIFVLGSINGFVGDEIRYIKREKLKKSSCLVKLFLDFFRTIFVTEEFDFITCIPSNKNHHLLSMLAQEISYELGIPYYSMVQFFKDIPEQKKLDSYEDRYKNVKNAFTFIESPNIHDRILLIDDVYASGATLKEVLNMFHYKQCFNVVSIIFAYRDMQNDK